MLFSLFECICDPTLLYLFKIQPILERTSSGFCTFAFWSSNVCILTFASHQIFSWPLVENPHFNKTVKNLIGFHQFRNTLGPHLKIFHFFFVFFQNCLQNPLLHLRFLDHFLTKCSFSTTYTHISKSPKATICCPNYHNFVEISWFFIEKHIYIYADWNCKICYLLSKSINFHQNPSFCIHLAYIYIRIPTPSSKMNFTRGFPM